jgi:hypothetical protein
MAARKMNRRRIRQRDRAGASRVWLHGAPSAHGSPFSRCIRTRVFVTNEKICASNGREAFHFASPEKGGGAPNGAPAVPASERDAGAVIRDRSPFGAPPRLCAEIFRPQLGLGRASWNRRMQTGGPSPTPVQQAPCSPITRRTGRCPNRLKAEVTSSCNSGTAPAPSVRVTGDVPHEKRDGAEYHYR